MQHAFWLEQCAEEISPTNSLSGVIDTDIAIIGGGYVGLWTALQIRKKTPTASITILEKNFCGSGASG